MSSYQPSPSFENAVKFLSSSSSLKGVSNTIKLELYGLYKYVTTSPQPNTSRPGMLDFAGRAKWDAWRKVGETYKGEPEAEEKYLEIAKSLGWENGVKVAVEEATTPKQDLAGEGDEGIWDNDVTPNKSGPGGLGNVVSTMAPPNIPNTIHGYTMSGNIDALKAHIETHPETDLNELDENGYTPLHLACDRGHKAVVEYLLQQGVDTSIQDPDEFTAVELARVAEHEGIVALLE